MFSREECKTWLADKTRNPRTGRMIDPNAKRGVYAQLQQACAQLPDSKDLSPDAKYCRCLMQVRAQGKTPYGICHKSVLAPRGIKRAPFCDYKLTDFTTAELLAYGREYETRKTYTFRLTEKAAKGDRRALLKDLKGLHEFLKSRRAAAAPAAGPTDAAKKPAADETHKNPKAGKRRGQ